MKLASLLAILLAGVVAAPALGAPAAGEDPYEKMLPLLTADVAKPLDVKEEGRVRKRDSFEEHDISYVGPKGRVTAYLLVPEGKGPFAGILFMHGATGTRRSLLPGARLMCQAGAVCLLIDAPYRGDRMVMGKSLTDITKPQEMRAGLIQLVIELRRGVDLLTARPDVDSKRIGFVGASIGGSVGGILAGVEKRIAAYALLTAAGNWTDAALKTDDPFAKLLRAMMSGEAIKKATDALSPLDPTHYVGHAAPAALLFQCGRKDNTTPEECARALQDAASEPKTVKWYDAGHELDIQAFKDRAEWFHEKIGLGPTPEPTSLKGLNH